MATNYQSILPFLTTDRLPFFQIAEKYITPESRIADYGCGIGKFAESIKRDDVFLIDSNSETVSFLKRKYKNVFLSSANVLPFENNFFDLIHCSHVIEHLYPNELYDLLCEFNRCLKPNGYLIISTPLMHPGFYDDMSHIKPYSPYVIIKYLTKNSNENLTRKNISSAFTVIEIINRYSEVSINKLTINILNSFVNKIFQKIKKVYYKLGFRSYIINGYTIVLKKESLHSINE